MGTVSGRYVKTFADADLGMLEGVSRNAPYDFFWVDVQGVDGDVIVCTGAGKPMRLPFRRTRRGDRARVTVQDPVFGPLEFEVHPFSTKPPAQAELGLI